MALRSGRHARVRAEMSRSVDAGSGSRHRRRDRVAPRQPNRGRPRCGFAPLEYVDPEVGGGEFVAIVGRPACDKSTLLNMLAGIDRPASGGVLVAGTPVQAFGQDRLPAWRGRVVGVVFRFFQILPR